MFYLNFTPDYHFNMWSLVNTIEVLFLSSLYKIYNKDMPTKYLSQVHTFDFSR